MVIRRLVKTEEFPRIHWDRNAFRLSAVVSQKDVTMIPIVMHDEGLGLPSSVKVNPKHSSFASTASPNCYPDSKIYNIFTQLTVSLTKGALETDKVHHFPYYFMVVFVSFEDGTITDALTGDKIEDILELQRETTDRQTYPLWNGTKLTELYTGSATLNTNVPGLTTTQVIEGIDFSPDGFYNAVSWYSNNGKLKKCNAGLKWRTLTKTKPIHTIQIHQKAKAKAINEYGFLGVIIGVPTVSSYNMPIPTADLTSIDHVTVTQKTRYSEWNHNFDMEKD